MKAVIRLRMSEAHYAGGLVDGAKMLQLFGDVATEQAAGDRIDRDPGEVGRRGVADVEADGRVEPPDVDERVGARATGRQRCEEDHGGTHGRAVTRRVRLPPRGRAA